MFRSKKKQDPFKAIQDCLQKRDYKGALNWFHNLLKRDPRNTQIRLRFADTLVLAGSRKEAVNQYRKVADQMADKGFMIRAIAINKKILKLDPTQKDVHEKLAEINQERAETAAEGTLGRSLARRMDAAADAAADEDVGDEPRLAEPDAPVASPVDESDTSTESAPSSIPQSLRTLEESMALEFGDISADSPTAVIEPEPPKPPVAIAEPTPPDTEADDDEEVVVLDFDDISASPPSEADAADVEIMVETAGPNLEEGFDAFSNAPSLGIEVDDPLSESEEDPAPSMADLSDVVEVSPIVLEVDSVFSGEGESLPGFEEPILELEPELEPELAASPANGPETVPLLDVADQLPEIAASVTKFADDEPVDDDNSGFELDDEGFELEELEVDLEPEAAADGAHALIGELDEDVDSLIDSIISDMDVPASSMEQEEEPAPTHIPLFSDLTMPEFVDVAILLLRRVAKPGEQIVRQGEPGNSMYIVSTGEVKAMMSKGGQELPVATLKDGQFFGEMALLSGEPRSATIVATKNTELLELNKVNFDEICRRHPHVEAKIRLAYDERTSRI